MHFTKPSICPSFYIFFLSFAFLLIGINHIFVGYKPYLPIETLLYDRYIGISDGFHSLNPKVNPTRKFGIELEFVNLTNIVIPNALYDNTHKDNRQYKQWEITKEYLPIPGKKQDGK